MFWQVCDQQNKLWTDFQVAEFSVILVPFANSLLFDFIMREIPTRAYLFAPFPMDIVKQWISYMLNEVQSLEETCECYSTSMVHQRRTGEVQDLSEFV